MGMLLLLLWLTQCGGSGGICGGDNSMLFLLILLMLFNNGGMGGLCPK